MRWLHKTGLRYGLVAVLAYGLFLVTNLPASLAVDFITSRMGDAQRIQLGELQGTLWSGQAASAKVSGITLGKLQWDLSFLPLLIGQVDVDIRFRRDDGYGKGNISIGLGGDISFQDVEARLPAEALMPLFYGMPIVISGQLSVILPEGKVVKGKTLNVRGRLTWHDAALTVPQPLEYGDLLITAEPQGEGSQLVLADQGGPLLAEGTVTVKGNGQYSVNINLASRKPAGSSLSNALRMLGRPNAEGKIPFSKSGKLKGW